VRGLAIGRPTRGGAFILVDGGTERLRHRRHSRPILVSADQPGRRASSMPSLSNSIGHPRSAASKSQDISTNCQTHFGGTDAD
jgi:hypothetical protein